MIHTEAWYREATGEAQLHQLLRDFSEGSMPAAEFDLLWRRWGVSEEQVIRSSGPLMDNPEITQEFASYFIDLLEDTPNLTFSEVVELRDAWMTALEKTGRDERNYAKGYLEAVFRGLGLHPYDAESARKLFYGGRLEHHLGDWEDWRAGSPEEIQATRDFLREAALMDLYYIGDDLRELLEQGEDEWASPLVPASIKTLISAWSELGETLEGLPDWAELEAADTVEEALEVLRTVRFREV